MFKQQLRGITLLSLDPLSGLNLAALSRKKKPDKVKTASIDLIITFK